jgi:hypothetical protein
MTAITNPTVKKADNVTDIVWTGVQTGGQASDRPAIWQSATIGTAVAHRPELRYWVKRLSGNKGEVHITGQYPSLSTDTTTGITSIIGRQKFNLVLEIDQNLPNVDIGEFVSQSINMLDDATMVSTIKSLQTWT